MALTNESANEDKHHRVKVLYLGEGDILSFANALARNTPPMQILGLPDDVEVASVHYDYSRRSFAFHICSMEWPPVESGHLIPSAECKAIIPNCYEDDNGNVFAKWIENFSVPCQETNKLIAGNDIAETLKAELQR